MYTYTYYIYMYIYKLTLSTKGPRFVRFEISLLLKKCLVEYIYIYIYIYIYQSDIYLVHLVQKGCHLVKKMKNSGQSFKVCVRYVFASLFFMSKIERF